VRTILIAVGITAIIWAALVAALVIAGRKSAAKELATLLPNLIGLFRGLIRDPRVPRRSKLLLGLAIAWFVSPIDLIPEFLPVIGPLDDAVVAALVLRSVLRRTGRTIAAEHWRGDPETLERLLRIAGAPTTPS